MAENKPVRYFNLDEANALVIILRPLVAEMLEIRAEILERQPEVWPVLQKAAGNGGSRATGEAEAAFNRLNALVHQIQSYGALVKDVNTGLLDFPFLREGREVYLCWKYGEDEIQFWHEVDGGFAGRRAL